MSAVPRRPALVALLFVVVLWADHGAAQPRRPPTAPPPPPPPPATAPAAPETASARPAWDWYRDVLAPGFGVFLGVIAGTFVTLACQWVLAKLHEQRQVRNLVFELRMNVHKLDKWLEEATKLRNAVNANALQSYYGYFDLSRYISVTANNMFVAGLLYKHLHDAEIESLQVITSEISVQGERVLAEQIAAHKANFVQANAVATVNFWDDKLQAHRATLQAIVTRLTA